MIPPALNLNTHLGRPVAVVVSACVTSLVLILEIVSSFDVTFLCFVPYRLCSDVVAVVVGGNELESTDLEPYLFHVNRLKR